MLPARAGNNEHLSQNIFQAPHVEIGHISDEAVRQGVAEASGDFLVRARRLHLLACEAGEDGGFTVDALKSGPPSGVFSNLHWAHVSLRE